MRKKSECNALLRLSLSPAHRAPTHTTALSHSHLHHAGGVEKETQGAAIGGGGGGVGRRDGLGSGRAAGRVRVAAKQGARGGHGAVTHGGRRGGEGHSLCVFVRARRERRESGKRTGEHCGSSRLKVERGERQSELLPSTRAPVRRPRESRALRPLSPLPTSPPGPPDLHLHRLKRPPPPLRPPPNSVTRAMPSTPSPSRPHRPSSPGPAPRRPDPLLLEEDEHLFDVARCWDARYSRGGGDLPR